MSLYDRIRASQNSLYLSSLQLLEDCVQKYGLTGVCLSFNGGKDCTVILHLLFAVIDHCRATGVLPASMTPFDVKAIYFETKDQFPGVEQFMHAMQQRYGYEQMELCGSFKPALIALLEAHPIKAIVMGQRRIDPDATTLEPISSSDVHRGWPEFLRINAILDWPYDAVWKFLLEFDLPYCSLYDLGYTSLGTRLDSFPNPHLQKTADELSAGAAAAALPPHWPAHRLADGSLERAGRSDKKNYAAKQSAEAADQAAAAAVHATASTAST